MHNFYASSNRPYDDVASKHFRAMQIAEKERAKTMQRNIEERTAQLNERQRRYQEAQMKEQARLAREQEAMFRDQQYRLMMAEARLAREKENEAKQKIIKVDNSNLKMFLKNYCEIRDDLVAVIMHNLPVDASCNMIYYATTSFLNDHIPAICVKNITDALNGKLNKKEECPLCYIGKHKGPKCHMHDIPVLIKPDKCSICLTNMNDTSTSCGHEFCQTCLDDWLSNNRTCPVCRVNL